MNRSCPHRALPIELALGLGRAGCGGTAEADLPRVAVSGTLTRDDKPLETGAISFTPDGQGQAHPVSVGP